VESRRVADLCVVSQRESAGQDRRIADGTTDERSTAVLFATSLEETVSRR